MAAPTEKCRLLVLGVRPSGESGRIVKAYSDAFGLQSYWIYSIHSKSAPIKPAHLLPLTVLEAVVTKKSHGQGLEKIKEVRSLVFFERMHTDPARQSIVYFVAEIWQNALREEQGDTGFFDELVQWLQEMDRENKILSMAPIEGVLLLLQHLGMGLEPPKEALYFDCLEGCFCKNAPTHPHAGSKEMVWAWSQWTQKGEVPPHFLRSELLDVLLTFLRIHAPWVPEPKSLPILREMLKA